jgi:hypothetical protein
MTYKLNGKRVSREEFLAGAPGGSFLERIPMIATACRQNNPRRTESIGVLPHQVSEERRKLQVLKDKGELTGVSICDDGSVEYTCNGEQGAIGWQRYRGNKVNLDGGYSDTYTPDNRFGAERE